MHSKPPKNHRFYKIGLNHLSGLIDAKIDVPKNSFDKCQQIWITTQHLKNQLMEMQRLYDIKNLSIYIQTSDV